MRPDKKGFTLIELMISVSIIGILAAVALPKFATMLEKSREAATKGDIGAIKSAIFIYIGEWNGSFPSDLTGWFSNNTTLTQQYLSGIPNVKVTGNNHYAQPGFTSPQGRNVTSGQNMTAGDFSINGMGWRYDSSTGQVWVNSCIRDSSNVSYTVYGYE